MAKEYLVQVVAKGPTNEYDQIGYLGSDDYINYEEGEWPKSLESLHLTQKEIDFLNSL